MTKNQMDDGRRRMPKSWCPYCHSRALDSRTVELQKSIKLVPLSSPEAEYFIICPGCHKTIGMLLLSLHETPTTCPAANA